MKRVLITGGTGFVGRAVVKALYDHDVEIHLITRKAAVENTQVSMHQASLMDYEKVNRIVKNVQPDYLIHLAWNVEHSTYLQSKENLLWVGASLNLVMTFAEQGGEKAFLCGTCFEYEFEAAPFTENRTKVKPLTLYAQCKASLHDMAKKYFEDQNIPFVWGRLFYLFGEHEGRTRVVPYAITELLMNNVVTCKNASAIRDYMYVGDAGRAIVKTLFSPVCGDVNIASGKLQSMGEIFKFIGKQCEALEKVKLLDEPVIPKAIVANVDILKEQVGFTEFTGVEHTLEKTIVWWRGRLDEDD